MDGKKILKESFETLSFSHRMKLYTQHWIAIGIGGWLVISPWVLGFYTINLATWNAIIAGVTIAFVALWDALSRTEAQK